LTDFMTWGSEIDVGRFSFCIFWIPRAIWHRFHVIVIEFEAFSGFRRPEISGI